MNKAQAREHERRGIGSTLATVFFSVVSVIYLLPVAIVLMNSFKIKTRISLTPFEFPTKESFAGLSNYVTGMTYGNFPFYKSVLYSLTITVLSVFAILLCTSMCAWFVVRVSNIVTKLFYGLCVFSMVVPFQMVMFTLSKTADTLGLGNPIGIVVVYLGFGAGLAVFMFCGFVKSIPREIEEAATIDGCGPVRTFFSVVLPVMKPTLISVGILQTMWIWNDYLLPYLVLDIKKYRTIPIHIQYLRGNFGTVDMGAIMALIVLGMIPIVIFYFTCQKHIVRGIAAGAVKG